MKKYSRVKGFTLMELIIVIAIIGILLGILGPTMMGYYNNSRVKDANADAKMVYNAAQTEVQKFVSVDRVKDESDASIFKNLVMISYNAETGAITYAKTKTDAFAVPTGEDLEECQEILEGVSKVVSNSENTNWAIYVEDYIVKAAITGDSQGTNFVGKCSANNYLADGKSSRFYSQCLPTAGDAYNELVVIADTIYDAVETTEAPTT